MQTYKNKNTSPEEQVKETYKWTSTKVEELMDRIDNGVETKTTPFWDNKPEWRLANIVYEYTQEEIEELKRCATDVIYFANKYCFVMTDDGIKNINLRDYQEDVLRDFQDNRFICFLAPRQVGKCVTFTTKIKIYDSILNIFEELTIGEFYFRKKKETSGLTFLESIKLLLYKAYSKL